MKQIERYIFGPVDAVRPFLLLRGLLLLLAFDCWLDLVPHGGRYGVGGFNVAHFEVLDLLPVPTPEIYVGSLLLVGLLSFVLAFSRPTRPALALLFVLYTYGWTMSMLDSYQHHYLISLLLFSCIFFPVPSREELAPGEPKPGVAVGGLLLALGLGEIVMGMANATTLLSILGLEGPVAWAARIFALLVGLLMVFLPDSQPPATTSKSKKKKRKQLHKTKAMPARISAWAYVSFGITCAIVYFYTAITKTAPDWREGHALRRLGHSEAFRELETLATGEGLPVFGVQTVEGFWELMAHGAIAVQLVTFVGFLVAARQDGLKKLWHRAIAVGLMLAPLSFHIGAELLSLEIGWFSFYMLFVVLIFFLPAELLHPMARGFMLPAQIIKLPALKEGSDGRFEIGVMAAASAAAAVGLLLMVDLPGGLGAGIIAALLLVVGVAWALRGDKPLVARSWTLATAAGAALLYLSIAATETRYDYYRFIGGDHRRRGEYAMALSAYEKANRYVVKPFCVRPRSGPIRECFRTEEQANELLDDLGRGNFEMRKAREEAEREMRRRVEAEQP